MSSAEQPSAALLRAELEPALAALGIEADAAQIVQLLAFLELLAHWNHAYNLTGVKDPIEMVHRHLVDSLSIAPHLSGHRVLDVGTGAGLPGIPLAICAPQREYHLLDSNGKKMRFLFQAKTRLRLTNVTLHHGRAEALSDPSGFDNILSRAVGSLAELVRISGHLLAPGGSLLAMKSTLQPGELNEVRAPYTVLECIDLRLPGSSELRQLVRICRD